MLKLRDPHTIQVEWYEHRERGETRMSSEKISEKELLYFWREVIQGTNQFWLRIEKGVYEDIGLALFGLELNGPSTQSQTCVSSRRSSLLPPEPLNPRSELPTMERSQT